LEREERVRYKRRIGEEVGKGCWMEKEIERVWTLVSMKKSEDEVGKGKSEGRGWGKRNERS
jgi:hypothetical protein